MTDDLIGIILGLDIIGLNFLSI